MEKIFVVHSYVEIFLPRTVGTSNFHLKFQKNVAQNLLKCRAWLLSAGLPFFFFFFCLLPSHIPGLENS